MSLFFWKIDFLAPLRGQRNYAFHWSNKSKYQKKDIMIHFLSPSLNWDRFFPEVKVFKIEPKKNSTNTYVTYLVSTLLINHH